jgi:hypothetical protein
LATSSRPQAGELAQAAAAVGAGEPADRDRHAVQDRDRRVVGHLREEVGVQALLGRPEVGGLAGEGGAVDPAQGGEPLAPVAAEVGVQAGIGVDAEELSDDLDREDFAVGQGRGRAALA